MIIRNTRNKKTLSSTARHCTSPLSQAIGLMFSVHNPTLLFEFPKERNIALHMWFVFYPIDVLFLNRKKQVVDLKEDFKPFAFYQSKQFARYAIEAPIGTIVRTKTKLGDYLSF